MRRGCYATALVVNAVLLYSAHRLLEWGVPFLTPSFNDVLWALDLSLGATVLANAAFIAYDSAWFRHVSDSGWMDWRCYPCTPCTACSRSSSMRHG